VHVLPAAGGPAGVGLDRGGRMTDQGYVIGCRCRICRGAYRDACADTRARRNEKRKLERQLRRDPNADFDREDVGGGPG
jgi:hypothetical protein